MIAETSHIVWAITAVAYNLPVCSMRVWAGRMTTYKKLSAQLSDLSALRDRLPQPLAKSVREIQSWRALPCVDTPSIEPR